MDEDDDNDKPMVVAPVVPGTGLWTGDSWIADVNADVTNWSDDDWGAPLPDDDDEGDNDESESSSTSYSGKSGKSGG